MLTRSPLTPWVRRLLVANAVVYLLTITVFTGPWFFQWFGFSPALVLQQPWTLGTYMFVHGGFFHLAFNMLVLFFFGTAVEGRMGGTEFTESDTCRSHRLRQEAGRGGTGWISY